jgi:hypothetical protein
MHRKVTSTGIRSRRLTLIDEHRGDHYRPQREMIQRSSWKLTIVYVTTAPIPLTHGADWPQLLNIAENPRRDRAQIPSWRLAIIYVITTPFPLTQLAPTSIQARWPRQSRRTSQAHPVTDAQLALGFGHGCEGETGGRLAGRCSGPVKIDLDRSDSDENLDRSGSD